MKSLVRVAIELIAVGCWFTAARLPAATIPEPDTIFYGRVLSYDHGSDVLLTQGEVVWKIQPNGDDTRTYELRTTLEAITNGPAVYSYRLKVPHEALVSGLAFSDLSPEVIALEGTAARYRHVDIQINGEPARLLPPAVPVFDVSASARLSAHRIDLEATLPLPDSDGQGLPDWWQQRFFGHLGVDPNGDSDGDGLTNLQEYQTGADPTLANTGPSIVWANDGLDEGATEVLTLQAVDADTPPTNLVYTVLQEPQGARLSLLFGAVNPGTNGIFGDKVLHADDTFTQDQVNQGRLAVTHTDPETNRVAFRLSLSDGSTNHPPVEAAFTLQIHKPTPDDGTGAAIWMSARFLTNSSLTQWTDASGPKPWTIGPDRPFDGLAGPTAVAVTNRGPLDQPVLAFNQPGTSPQQSLALPAPATATVFPSGEMTVIAVFNSSGTGAAAEQVVSGPHFQLGLTGPADHGRDHQVRFASEGAGVVFSNRRVKDQWVVLSAWREQSDLAMELNGNAVGGPHPLDPPTEFGTHPTVGARNNGGVVDQPFHGWLAEVLVFNRNLEDAERHRINYSLMSKWFGWVLLDGSDEPRDLNWRVPSTGWSEAEYRTNFVPKFGPDHNYILLGGGGHDILRGGQNDDIIVGGRKSDVMTGGGGRDTFVFNYTHVHSGADTITDFNPVTERDSINIADLLRGGSQDLRDFVRLRTDGHNSYLDFDIAGLRQFTNHSIVLQSTVLRDDDLPGLWANGNLITGDKRFPLTVSVTTAAPVATEMTAVPALLTVHLGGAIVPEGLEIPFELGGTAVRGADYTLSVQRYNPATGAYDWEPVTEHELLVKVKPGELDFNVRVEPLQNNHSQPIRTVQFQLTAVPEWFDVANASAGVKIVDGPQRVGIIASSPDASEAGAKGRFRLARSGNIDLPLDVTVAMTGPALNGVDYAYIPTVVHFDAGASSVFVDVGAYPDNERELPEAVEMVLKTGDGYFVDSSAQAATVVIQDSGPVITVEAIEPLAVVQEGSTGAFLLHRQGMLNEALTVLLDVAGTATPSLDYRRINRFATFGVGATTVLVSVAPLSTASIVNGAETVDLQISPDPSYAIGATSNAQVRLINAYVTFAQWKAQNFPGDATSLTQFANQDYDHDGIPNGVEYAFGLDPKITNPGKQGLPALAVQDKHLGVRFNRPLAVVDVAYGIEVSSDLLTWVTANDAFEAQPGPLKSNGLEEVTFIDREPMSTQPRRFVRIVPILQ